MYNYKHNCRYTYCVVCTNLFANVIHFSEKSKYIPMPLKSRKFSRTKTFLNKIAIFVVVFR